MQDEHSQGRRQWQAPEEREEHERGLIERVSDEIRSWFGQDESSRRRYDFDRPEYDEPHRGEYMSQGEEFMGPGFRSRSAGYQGYQGQQGMGQYGSQGMGQYGSQGHRHGMMGERMGERMGQGGQFGQYGGEGGQGRYYQQHHETYPQSMHPGLGFGGQGFGGQSFGGQGLGGQGFGSQSYGMQGHGWQGQGGQSFGGQGYGGQGRGQGYGGQGREQGFGGQGLGGQGQGGQSFGGQTEERGRFAGRGPKGYRRSDERVLEEACEALSRNPFIDASNIEVKVQQGKLSLTGTVDDREVKRLAEDLCEDISGVREVQNQLRVSRSASGLGMEEQGRTGEHQAQSQTSQTSQTSQSPSSGRGREA